MGILDDAVRNIAMMEAVYWDPMTRAAEAARVRPGFWSLPDMVRLIIPEDTAEEFLNIGNMCAARHCADVLYGLPLIEAFVSSLLAGVQLGREIERLAQTGKYPPLPPEESA